MVAIGYRAILILALAPVGALPILKPNGFKFANRKLHSLADVGASQSLLPRRLHSFANVGAVTSHTDSSLANNFGGCKLSVKVVNNLSGSHLWHNKYTKSLLCELDHAYWHLGTFVGFISNPQPKNRVCICVLNPCLAHHTKYQIWYTFWYKIPVDLSPEPRRIFRSFEGPWLIAWERFCPTYAERMKISFESKPSTMIDDHLLDTRLTIPKRSVRIPRRSHMHIFVFVFVFIYPNNFSQQKQRVYSLHRLVHVQKWPGNNLCSPWRIPWPAEFPSNLGNLKRRFRMFAPGPLSHDNVRGNRTSNPESCDTAWRTFWAMFPVDPSPERIVCSDPGWLLITWERFFLIYLSMLNGWTDENWFWFWFCLSRMGVQSFGWLKNDSEYYISWWTLHYLRSTLTPSMPAPRRSFVSTALQFFDVYFGIIFLKNVEILVSVNGLHGWNHWNAVPSSSSHISTATSAEATVERESSEPFHSLHRLSPIACASLNSCAQSCISSYDRELCRLSLVLSIAVVERKGHRCQAWIVSLSLLTTQSWTSSPDSDKLSMKKAAFLSCRYSDSWRVSSRRCCSFNATIYSKSNSMPSARETDFHACIRRRSARCEYEYDIDIDIGIGIGTALRFVQRVIDLEVCLLTLCHPIDQRLVICSWVRRTGPGRILHQSIILVWVLLFRPGPLALALYSDCAFDVLFSNAFAL